MLYYVEDLAETIRFYQGLLKENGRLMIVIEAGIKLDFNSFIYHPYNSLKVACLDSFL